MNAGVIGVGDMGRNHARIYNELENVELTAICDADEQRAVRVSKIYKVPRYMNTEEMLVSTDLDLVSVAVPTTLHFEIASLVIEAGINVLIEKPLDLSIERARSLVKRAKKNGVSLMVGHIERFNPAVIKLKEMIGELGTPTIALATRAGPLPKKVKDVGAIIDLGVHDIDVLRFILESEVKRLYCERGRILHANHTDYGKILLRFQNNILASIDVNWLTPVKIRRLVVQGLEAMFEVDYIRQELCKYEMTYEKEFSDWSDILFGMTEGEMRRIPITKEEPLKIELKQFVQSVREETPPPVTGEDGIKAVEIALRAEESGRRRKVIEF